MLGLSQSWVTLMSSIRRSGEIKTLHNQIVEVLGRDRGGEFVWFLKTGSSVPKRVISEVQGVPSALEEPHAAFTRPMRLIMVNTQLCTTPHDLSAQQLTQTLHRATLRFLLSQRETPVLLDCRAGDLNIEGRFLTLKTRCPPRR